MARGMLLIIQALLQIASQNFLFIGTTIHGDILLTHSFLVHAEGASEIL